MVLWKETGYTVILPTVWRMRLPEWVGVSFGRARAYIDSIMEGDWLYGDSTYCVAYALAGMGGSLFWESKSIYRQYLRSKWSAGVCDGFRNIAFLSECKAI